MTRKVQPQTATGSPSEGTPATDVRAYGDLLATLREVERDEAAAIDALCAVLERVEQSRDFSCLPRVRKVLKEWQNRPPGGIVTDLMRVCEEIK